MRVSVITFLVSPSASLFLYEAMPAFAKMPRARLDTAEHQRSPPQGSSRDSSCSIAASQAVMSQSRPP